MNVSTSEKSERSVGGNHGGVVTDMAGEVEPSERSPAQVGGAIGEGHLHWRVTSCSHNGRSPVEHRPNLSRVQRCLSEGALARWLIASLEEVRHVEVIPLVEGHLARWLRGGVLGRLRRVLHVQPRRGVRSGVTRGLLCRSLLPDKKRLGFGAA